MNIFDDITFQYTLRLGHHADEMSIILKGHLFIEYILNQIIELKCKNPSTILNDHRTYTFAVKLQILYSMGLIPHHIYLNIRKLNTIRNRLSHNLEFDEKEIDYKFFKEDGIITVPIKSRSRYPIRRYLKLLSGATLIQLRNHVFKEFGFFPKYISDRRVNA